MYRGIEVLRLLPDRPGRGGTKFGYHSFQQEPINDTRSTMNVHIWQDSWRSDVVGLPRATGSDYSDDSYKDPGEASSLSLHGYTKFSLSDPAVGPTTHILGHNITSIGGVTFGYIWDYTDWVDGTYDGTVNPPIWYGSTHKVCRASYTYPAVFANIGNRCFIASGSSEGVIYDLSHRSNFSSDGPGGVYAIGVDAPKAAPVIASVDVVDQAECYLRKTSIYMSHPDPSSALATPAAGPGTDTLQVDADGINWIGPPTGTTGIDIVSKTTVFPSSLIAVSIQNGTNIATFSPALSIPPDNEWVGLTLTVAGFSFVMMAFGNATPAETPALGSGQCLLSKKLSNGKLPGPGGGFDPDGDLDTLPFTVTGVRWTMQKGGVDKAWPTTGGLSGDNTVVGQMVNAGGMLTWDNTPPSYAYAWYDPLTGHVSNISPIFVPQATTATESGVRVNVDVGSISYPPSTSTVGSSRWTHILFFRTLMAGGSTLYPIGSLQPTVDDPSNPGAIMANTEWKGLPNGVVTSFPPVTTGNYWYDSARDSELLISGALRAPQFTNGKPKMIQDGEEVPLYPAHMAYWDGRLWIAATQDPAALHYSCDRVQCPFGIPEESFPDTNVIRIPASDGCVRGIKLIGEALLITTERWAYTVAGNNEANYRLVRISTRLAGVGDYQMDEFVPDVEGQAALVVFVGTDARVYAMPLGGQAVWISKEIQTYLSSASLQQRYQYNQVRVHCTCVNGRRLAIVYCPTANNALYPPPTLPGKTFMYDFDQKTWSEHTISDYMTFTNSGMGVSWASIQSSTSYLEEIYSIAQPNPPQLILNEVVLRLFDATYPVPMPNGYVRTFPLDFDGKKTRKQLHFVRLYVNDRSFTSLDPGTGATTYGWRVSISKDSATALGPVTPIPEYDPAYGKMAVGGSPVDSSTAAELIVTDAAISPDTTLLGYTFDVTVAFPEQRNKIYQLYRIDIGWSTVSDGGVDP